MVRHYTNPGFDAELLLNGNILLVLPRWGLLEVDRAGVEQWRLEDPDVSHDADRHSQKGYDNSQPKMEVPPRLPFARFSPSSFLSRHIKHQGSESVGPRVSRFVRFNTVEVA